MALMLEGGLSMAERITLAPLTPDDREAFIRENLAAFQDSAEEISRHTVEVVLDAAETQAYRILQDGAKVGGMVVMTERRRGTLLLLFVDPAYHSRGIGTAAWRAVEAQYPEIDVWETCTPYDDKRNIHFYVNRCGFQIVEFFCAVHPDPLCDPDAPPAGPQEMFRFEKIMRKRP